MMVVGLIGLIGLIMPALFSQGVAEPHVPVGILRVEADGLLEMVNGPSSSRPSALRLRPGSLWVSGFLVLPSMARW